MQLKRNLYVENIYIHLSTKHIFFFNENTESEIYDLNNTLYKYNFSNKNKELKLKVDELCKKKIFKDSEKFSIMDYIFIKMLEDNKSLNKFNGKHLMERIYIFFFKESQELHSDENQLTIEYIYKLDENIPHLKYEILSTQEIEEELECSAQGFTKYINICRILFKFYKFVELKTFGEYADYVKYDVTLMLLYCDVMINFSQTTKQKLILNILNIFIMKPNTNPLLLIVLMILGYTYDNIDLEIFNQKEYYFKFTSYKYFLCNYFKDQIHILDFDDFSLIHTIIYSYSLKNFSRDFTLRWDILELSKNSESLYYLIIMFKHNLRLKLYGSNNYIPTSQSNIFNNVLENMLNSYFLLDEKFFVYVNNILEEENQMNLIFNDSKCIQRSYNVEFSFDHIKSILIRLVFEKSSDYLKCIYFYLSYFSDKVKSQKISNLNFVFKIMKYKKYFFSSEMIFLNDKTLLNLNIDIYNIITHEGEICTYLSELFTSFKYSQYSKPLKAKNLIINLNTNTLEKVLENLEEKVKIVQKLLIYNFTNYEFNIVINSERGFEILEIILMELYTRLIKNNIIVSISLYEENPINLNLNRSKDSCSIYSIHNNEISQSVGDLFFYLFSLVSDLLIIRHLIVDVKLDKLFGFDGELSIFKNFSNISFNFFNNYHNVDLFRRIIKNNKEFYFREIEIIYYPFKEINSILNVLKFLRCGKLSLNIILEENELESMIAIRNFVKSIFALEMNKLYITFIIKNKTLFVEIRSIIIKSFEKNKFIHCKFILDENNMINYENVDTYLKWNMEKVDQFILNPEDFLLKTIVKMKAQFYTFLYLINLKNYKRIKKGPILKIVHDYLCKKVILIGELWKINKQ